MAERAAVDAPTRLLILEDSDDDADLLLRELSRSGLTVEARRVETEATFREQLLQFVPDVVLADLALPTYDGRLALELVKQERPETPLIFVSGSRGEELAIEVLKQGATDYVLKHRLQRLGLAVRRALHEGAERRARLAAERQLQRRLAYEAVTAECLQRLAASDADQSALHAVLERLLATADVSRVYLFRNERDPQLGVCMCQVDEVVAAGIAPQIDNPALRRLPYREASPALLTTLSAKQPFAGVVAELPELERSLLAEQGILAILLLPIFKDDGLWGFIGFDDCRAPRRWEEDDIRLLQVVADMIGVALHRQEVFARLGLQSAALNAAANAIVITDRDGRIEWVNPAWSRLTGYGPLECLGKNPRLLKSGEQDEAFYKQLWGTIAAGETWQSELINRRKDGSLYPEYETITPVLDAAGRVTHFVAIKEDISQRRAMEQSLRQSEERLRMALQAGGLGSFDWNIKSGQIVWSPKHYEIFGYGAQADFPVRFHHFSERVHPADVALVESALTRSMREKTPYACEYRVVWPDGSEYWVAGKGEFYYGDAPQPERMVGTVQDVTDRRMAEAQLHEYARQMEFRSNVGNAMFAHHELKQLFQQCAQAMVDFLDAGLARIWTLEPPYPVIQLSASAGAAAPADDGPRPIGQHRARQIAAAKQPCLTNSLWDDTSPDDPDRDWLRQANLTAFAGYPLLIEDRCLGVLTLFTRHPLGGEILDALQSAAIMMAQNLDRLNQRRQLAVWNSDLERKIEERTHRLAESERFNRATLDALSSHLAVLNSAGRIVAVNQAWKEFAAQHPGDWRSASETADYLAACDRAAAAGNGDAAATGRALREVLAGDREDWTCEYAGQSPGTERWFNGRVTRFSLDGEPHLLVAHEDVTAMKHTEQALREAKAGAEQASRAKSEFLAAMSHELRTPLNGVLGMNQLLLTTGLTDKQRQLVEISTSSGNLLLQLINDILDLSKIEAGRLDLDPRPVAIPQLVERAVAMLSPVAAQKGLALRCQVSAAAHLVCQCDDNRLQQVLVNLIGNAIKFTSTGTIAVCVDRLEADGLPRLRFRVVDTGIGIPQERRDRLFQKFSQVDSSTTRNFGGTGLGLSICKQLVELMGGRIGVESQVGFGSTFWFEIPAELVAGAAPAGGQDAAPAAAAERDDAHGAEPTAAAAPAASLLGGHVLLAEDNRINQLYMLELLKHFGCTADVANNGEEAVAAVERGPYDLVLMDCQMPELDGYQAAGKIRQIETADGRDHRLPIVALTANAMAGDRQRCLDAGMDDYLTKPIEVDRLRQILERYLPRRASTRDPADWSV